MGARSVANRLWEREIPATHEQSGNAMDRGPAQHDQSGVTPFEFLLVPPFPGAKVRAFNKVQTAAPVSEALLDRIRQLKVGGTYWAARPVLPETYVVVTAREALAAVKAISSEPIVLWVQDARGQSEKGVITISGQCDPWHVFERASLLVSPGNTPSDLIAALLDIPTWVWDVTANELNDQRGAVQDLATASIQGTYENPFTSAAMTSDEAVELCGFWRQLIDSNRDIAGGVGFAFWKQDHVAPLLWGGAGSFAFLRRVREPVPSGTIALWRAKAPPEQLSVLHSAGTPLIEVEDGFIRSQGLGADCVPPLSITVDRRGPHFDPAQVSDLEILLQDGTFSEEQLARARKLRGAIVAAGLGKYERDASTRLSRPGGTRRHILVPGQVEDDRSVECGGCGLTSNLDLLVRVRKDAPDACILYKPHPDVLAGHRRGSIPERACLEHADAIVADQPISALINMVDEVHVNTSLAGFEALMRAKVVTTHGVPFYAGWGLTRDLGPVPERRSSRRTLDELVAAVLLVYARYLDPVTGLPCPPEVVVERLGRESSRVGLIVQMRRLQGRLKRRLRSMAR